MAYKIDDASNFGSMGVGGRQVVRDSNGYLWTAVFDDPSNELHVWKSEDNGENWTQQDSSNSPTANSDSVAVAIDGSNNLHIVYWNSDYWYVDFTSGSFGTPSQKSNGYTTGYGCAVAVDSNDVPHIVVAPYDPTPGLNADYYNKVGGSWNAGVTIIDTASDADISLSIAINSEDIPVLCYLDNTNGDVDAKIGNANNATSFTQSGTINDSVNTTAGESGCSLAIDSNGDVWVAFVSSINEIHVAKQSSNWTDSWSDSNSTYVGYEPSLVIVGTDKYVFYEDSGGDINYLKYDGGWDSPTEIEGGTYQDVKARWALATQYDSKGNLVSSLRTYYFNDPTPLDNQNNYTDDVNGFNGNIANFTYTTTGGDLPTYYIRGDGTDAPASGGTIVGVKARMFTTVADGWSSWNDLSTPSGGWSWSVLQNLYVKSYYASGEPGSMYAYIYTSGDEALGNFSQGTGVTQGELAKIEIIVQTSDSPFEIDYLFSDGTDIYWNKLDLDKTLSTDQWLIEFLDTTTQTIQAKGHISNKRYTRTGDNYGINDDTDYYIAYSLAEYADVVSDDGDRVTQANDFAGESPAHLYKVKNLKLDDSQSIFIHWNGQVTTTEYDVKLDIYDYNGGSWENLYTGEASEANVDFDIPKSITSNQSNYYSNNWVAVRVWLQAPGSANSISTDLITISFGEARTITAKAKIVKLNVAAYYFDASDGGPTDPNEKWSSDDNAFNGSIGDGANTSDTGSTESNYLQGDGTNAPSLPNTIAQVRARTYMGPTNEDEGAAAIYTDGLGTLLGTAIVDDTEAGWGKQITLDVPAGGWTWAKIQALELKLYAIAFGFSLIAYRTEVIVFYWTQTTQTITAKASIGVGFEETTQTITAKARIGTGFEEATQTITSKGSIKKLSTQTIQAKSCIQKSFVQTLTALGRIQIATVQTITAKGRIKKGISQTITAKGAIKKQSTQTITAKSAIKKQFIQTITALGRIEKPFTQTIQSKARIEKPFTQSIAAKGNIQSTNAQSINAKGTIKKTFTQTIDAKASIQLIFTQTLTAKGRIQKSSSQTITSKGRIQIPSTQSITAKGRIKKELLQTLNAKASIKKELSQTINAKSAIKKTFTQTIEAKGRIGLITNQTLTAKGRISKPFTQTITAKADIKKSLSQTIESKASVKKTTIKSFTSKGRIQIAFTQSITARARIKKPFTQSIQSKARITATTIQTITAKSSIKKLTTQTITAKGKIQTIFAQTLTAKGRIQISTIQTINSKGRIKKQFEQTITAKASIKLLSTQTIQVKASIKKLSIQTIESKSRIQLTTTQTITAKGKIEKASTQTIQALGHISRGVIRTFTALASIKKSSSQSIDALGQIQQPRTQTLETKGRIQISSTQSISALARITKFFSQTITTQGNIKTTITQIVQAKAAIQRTFIQNIQSKGRIEIISTKTVDAKARITVFRTQTIESKGRILGAVPQTIDAKGNIKAVQTQTVTSKASIKKEFTQIIESKSRITIASIQVVTTKGRIEIASSKTIQVKGRITAALERTLQAKASIKKSLTQIITSKASIKRGFVQSITAKGRIQITSTQTIEAKANIVTFIEKTQTVESKARIQKQFSQNISAKGRIKILSEQTINAKANIQAIITQTITAKARIQISSIQLLTAKGRILGAITQTITAKGDIKKTTTRTIQTKGAVKKSFTQTISTKGRIQVGFTQTITAKARIQIGSIQTITARGQIEISSTQSLTAKARIGIIPTQTVESKANIKKTISQTITAKGRIGLLEILQSIESKARITKIQTQTIEAKASIRIPSEQTISSKAKIVCITKTILVSPSDLSEETSPVYLVWEIPSCCKNRNIHAHVQIDKTDNTFNDLEKDLYSFRDSDFEYWDGGSWQTYPTTGVVSAYYGNQARVQVTLTPSTKYWRVRGGVK